MNTSLTWILDLVGSLGDTLGEYGPDCLRQLKHQMRHAEQYEIKVEHEAK